MLGKNESCLTIGLKLRAARVKVMYVFPGFFITPDEPTDDKLISNMGASVHPNPAIKRRTNKTDCRSRIMLFDVGEGK